MKYFYYVVIVSIIVSCSSKEKTEDQASTNEGVVKSYRGDGTTLFSEVTYHNGKRNGLSKTYHPDGKVYLEEWYVNDKKHGQVTQYYQSGVLHSETNYDSGSMHGIVIKYHKDGKLKAESRFNHDCPCVGLKEYILNGDPRPSYPEIVVTMDDQLLTRASYYVNLTVSERVKEVEFFKGSLKDGCFHKGLEPITMKAKEKGQIDLSVGPDGLIDQRINVIAKIETIAGNILITQKLITVKAGYKRDY